MASTSYKTAGSGWSRQVWVIWGGALIGGSILLGLAILPPWIPAGLRSILMDAFAPLCHQLPLRSPTMHGIPIAVCDRCLGIYAGFAVGTVLTRPSYMILRSLGTRRHAPSSPFLARLMRYVLIATLALLALDWAGPVVGQWVPSIGWTNNAWSRAMTGSTVGAAAAFVLVFTTVSRNGAPTSDAASGQEAASSRGAEPPSG